MQRIWIDRVWCFLGTTIVVLATFLSGEGVLPLCAAVTGVWYVLLAGQGRVSAFLPGAVNILLYAYLSWQNAYYGELLLQMLYYFPMNIAGWFLWRRHVQEETGCIQKRRLPPFKCALLLVSAVGSILAFGVFLQWMGGQRVWLDSVTTVLSVFAQALAVGRYAEQWVLWVIVNAVSVVLWFGADVSAIVMSVMWGFYLCYAVAMAIRWHRETV